MNVIVSDLFVPVYRWHQHFRLVAFAGLCRLSECFCPSSLLCKASERPNHHVAEQGPELPSTKCNIEIKAKIDSHKRKDCFWESDATLQSAPA